MQSALWGRSPRRLVTDHQETCSFLVQPHRRKSNLRACGLAEPTSSCRQLRYVACAATVTDGPSASQAAVNAVPTLPPDHRAHWYAVIANSEFMLHDVQNESFAEQLRERRRMFGEKNMPIDFFLVPEPEWLDRNFPAEGRRVGRPSLALVSPDKTWITFMKLRLDRVLKLDLGEMTQEQAVKSAGSLPQYGPLDKGNWTAPYAPYRPGWWEMFMPKNDKQTA